MFDADIRARASARLEATTALRRALSEGELRLHYQPVIDLADERLLGFETLVRWQHPEQGLLGPGAFIADAEETGLIVPLGEWVLRTALEQSARWGAMGTASAPPQMSVNVSARQLDEPDLAGVIARALEASAFAPSALTLEITESVVMRDVLRNVEHLRALREIGVDLSIDDFGTGYSSLVYLKRLPVTTLKIDREFVDGLGRTRTTRPSSPPSSRWPGRWSCASWPKAWRRRANWPSCGGSAATPRRGSCSRARSLPRRPSAGCRLGEPRHRRTRSTTQPRGGAGPGRAVRTRGEAHTSTAASAAPRCARSLSRVIASKQG